MLGKLILSLFSCLLCNLSILCSSAFALQQADFSWLPNGEPNLTGYKIYYSKVSAQYDKSVNVGNPGVINGVVQATVNGLEDGTTYYFAATAYDSESFESDYSQEVVWTSPVDEPVPPQSPPVANDLSLSISEDIPGTGQLNGQSSNGLSLTYQIVTNGSKGTALITNSGAGTFSYTPQVNFNGSDSFSYKVSDANGESTAATVTITITPVNDAPTVDEQLVFTNEDQVLMGSLTAHDVEGDSLTYTIGNNASHGSVIINAGGSYSYTPAADFNSSDSFTFLANDGSVYSNSAIVNISINPVNDVPLAYDDWVNVQENQTATGIVQGSDIDSGQLTYSVVSNGILGTATIVDPATGNYTYTPNNGAIGEDSFRFIVRDGSGESNQATVHITIQQAASSFAMEIGELTVDGTWSYISFTKTFQDPVVVAKPASNNDPSPCVVRIRNMTPVGFEIRLQQFDYLVEEHGEELVSFIAMERGSFTLDDGSLYEAGRFATDKTSSYENVNFSQSFNNVPVVSASVVSANGSDAVVGRISGINETGFGYKLSEQEINAEDHVFETIAYIAWEPSVGMIGDLAYEVGTTGDVVTHAWHTINFSGGFANAPVFVSDMQTTDGSDTANMRYENLTAATTKIKVAEEASRDSEVAHTTENIGFMAFSVIDMAGDADNDGLTTGDERLLFGTNPGLMDSDADGLDDGVELDFWGSAWDADADNDGLVNLLDSDSDNDGYMDGEEIDQGYDPADASSNPDAIADEPDEPANVITLDVNAYKIWRRKIVELFWSGADGRSVQIKRIRENGETYSKIVPNENYYKEKVRKRGVYTYQVCEPDNSVCSDAVTLGL